MCIILHICLCSVGAVFLGMLGAFTYFQFEFLIGEEQSIYYKEDIDYLNLAIPYWVAAGIHFITAIGLVIYYYVTKPKELNNKKKKHLLLADYVEEIRWKEEQKNIEERIDDLQEISNDNENSKDHIINPHDY